MKLLSLLLTVPALLALLPETRHLTSKESTVLTASSVLQIGTLRAKNHCLSNAKIATDKMASLVFQGVLVRI
jgi:hypothetical protein